MLSRRSINKTSCVGRDWVTIITYHFSLDTFTSDAVVKEDEQSWAFYLDPDWTTWLVASTCFQCANSSSPIPSPWNLIWSSLSRRPMTLVDRVRAKSTSNTSLSRSRIGHQWDSQLTPAKMNRQKWCNFIRQHHSLGSTPNHCARLQRWKEKSRITII